SLLEFLLAEGGAPAATLNERLGSWREAARSLLARGWIARTERAPEAQAQAPRVRAAGPALLPEQSAAVEAVTASLGRFGAFVLHGITGSGKTEVYLRLIERVLARGERALVLVPEIGLTPQLLGRFRERFEAPLAVMRAQRTGVPVLLGSATPALETLHNVAAGRYALLRLQRRAAQSKPPRLALLDLRTSAVRSGLATPAVLAIERHLAADGQVLVFLNRRGYAPTLLCTACGWIAPCRECDARLTVHLAAARLRCHHCGADAPLPQRCPQCGFAVKPVGQGTQRIEETLGSLFPGASMA